MAGVRFAVSTEHRYAPFLPPAGALGAPGDFTLKSGRKSTWFIDSKQTVCRPEAMVLVAEAVLSLMPDEANAIGGLTMGADPVAFVTAGVAATRGRAPQGLQRAQGSEGPRRPAAGLPAPSTRATRWW